MTRPFKIVDANKDKAAPAAARPTQSDQVWSARRSVLSGVVSLVLLIAGFGGWAIFTQISGAIIASGRVEVDRNRQVIQHPNGGVVSTIEVLEGDVVKKGDVLIRLDPTLLRSSYETTDSQFLEVQARFARLSSERDGGSTIVFPEELTRRAKDEPQVAELMDGQERLFEARLVSLENAIEQMAGRRKQIEIQIEGIEAQDRALVRQIAVVGEELEDQTFLLDRGLTQATRVLTLHREEAQLQGSAGELVASAAEAAERMAEIDLQALQLKSARREEAIAEMRDLQVRELELASSRAALAEQLNRLDIKASVSGVIHGLSIFAEQSVIRPADPLLYIIPQDRPLIITVKVEPTSIDQVQVGQDVVIKLSALDPRTTPELVGSVVQVSADSFTDDASQASYYKAEIRLKDGEIKRLPAGVHMIPGMPVEAFIQTEDQTPIAYLIQPLKDYFDRAFRER